MTKRDREKDELCASLYQGGATLQEIGDLLGVTRQCVEQRLERFGLPRRTAGPSVDPLAIVAACRRPDVQSFSDVAASSGFNPETIRRTLKNMGLLEAVQRLYRMRRGWTQRQRLIAGMQALASELGRTPTVVEFVAERIWMMDLVRYFGSIGNAVVAAGLVPRPRGTPGHLHRSVTP